MKASLSQSEPAQHRSRYPCASFIDSCPNATSSTFKPDRVLVMAKNRRVTAQEAERAERDERATSRATRGTSPAESRFERKNRVVMICMMTMPMIEAYVSQLLPNLDRFPAWNLERDVQTRHQHAGRQQLGFWSPKVSPQVTLENGIRAGMQPTQCFYGRVQGPGRPRKFETMKRI
jgi:hypothetical protein